MGMAKVVSLEEEPALSLDLEPSGLSSLFLAVFHSLLFKSFLFEKT